MEKKINAVIIEDDESSLSHLELLIKTNIKNINVLATAGSVTEAIKIINSSTPDLLFLDIDLPDGTGFDIPLKTKHKNYKIIFTTVHNKYAARAFKLSALHYLLKPIHPEELKEAVNRFSMERFSDLDERLNIFKDSITERPQKILLPAGEGIEIVNISDIIRCEAEGSYSGVVFNDGRKITISRPLIRLVEILDELNFERIHKKHLINLKYLKKYKKNANSEVIMSSGESIPVSNTRKKQFEERLMKFAKNIS